MQNKRRIDLAYAVLVTAVICLLFGFRYEAETGFTSLIRFGKPWVRSSIPEMAQVPVRMLSHGGYDGQFYAYLALRPPWRLAEIQNNIDDVPFRARRIFLPTIAHVLGGGQPWWIIHIYSVLNPLAWLGLAALLLKWLPPNSWENFGRWGGCLLSAGVLESIRASLTDLPALLFALIGLGAWQARGKIAAVPAFVAAVLTREVLILCAIGVLRPDPRRKSDRLRSAACLAAIFLPTALWSFYLLSFGPGAMGAVEEFSGPFFAIARAAQDSWRHLANGDSDNGRYLFRLVTIFAMAFQAWIAWRGRASAQCWWRFGAPFILLYPFLGWSIWESPWSIWRAVLPLTIAFCFLIPSGRWFWLCLAVGSLPSVMALFRLAF